MAGGPIAAPSIGEARAMFLRFAASGHLAGLRNAEGRHIIRALDRLDPKDCDDVIAALRCLPPVTSRDDVDLVIGHVRASSVSAVVD